MLNIQKVILSEFCQHEYLELELSSGLTGLFGSNGRGKSNIANAICGAFTGNFNRHSEGAAGCIRQNQPNDAYVEIHGTIAGQPFRLRRDLTHRGVKHSLWLGGDKHRTYDKAGDIEAWLTDVSGLTPQIMAEFLFIGQQDLYGFLETTDANRSKKFAALCGTRGYDHRRDVYYDFLKQDKAKMEAVNSVSVEFLEAAIRDALANLDDVEAAIAACQQNVDAPGSKIRELEIHIDGISKKMRDAQEQKALVAKYANDLTKANSEHCQQVERRKKTEKSESALSIECRKALEQYQNAANQFKESLQGRTFAEILEELREIQKQLIGYDNLVVQLEKAETSLRNLVKPESFDEKRYNETNTRKENYVASSGETGAKILSISQLLKALRQLKADPSGAISECPLCGAHADHWNVDLSTLEELLSGLNHDRADLDNKIAECDEELRQLNHIRSLYTRYCEKQESLINEIGKLKSTLNAFENVDTERDIDNEIDTLLAERKNMDSLSHRHKTLATQHEAEIKALEQIEERIHHLEKVVIPGIMAALDGIGKDQKELQKLYDKYKDRIEVIRKEIQSLRELEDQLNVLYGSKQASEKQLADLRARLEEQKNTQESQGATAAWLDKCERALNWLKKDGLPRLIHRSVLEQLVSTINRELTCFDSPFEVTVNDDLTFTATFPNGTRSVARDLSGGQKVMLAMAFWSAINRTFAQNLGIMILDEPTDGLDQDNRQCLYRIMEEWAKLLRRRGQQVIIITHDIEMEDSFDSVFLLEPQDSKEAA